MPIMGRFGCCSKPNALIGTVVLVGDGWGVSVGVTVGVEVGRGVAVGVTV